MLLLRSSGSLGAWHTAAAQQMADPHFHLPQFEFGVGIRRHRMVTRKECGRARRQGPRPGDRWPERPRFSLLLLFLCTFNHPVNIVAHDKILK